MKKRTCQSLSIVTLLVAVMASTATAQVSPEEHAKHHPGQAAAGKAGMEAGKGGTGGGGGMMGGEKGGMMGGGMGGMMDGMMEKMGAPKPKELYPRLMDLPDLPMEERAKIQEEAHQRMIDGTGLLSDGLERLSSSAAGDDFAAMQAATATLREGLAQFESGLAAHRAIAEGKAPRNVALQWFKREMNLLPPAGIEPGFRLWGMSAFHTAVMAILVAFAGAMIWMYFFKMRRASELLQRLATKPDATGAAGSKPGKPASPPEPAAPAAAKKPRPAADETKETASGETPDCCSDSGVECASEATGTDRPDISQGLLRVQKRKLCRMRVARIFQETPDVKTFRLVACHGGALPFSYFPGQFLTLTLPVTEKPIRRSYTISSSPTQGYYCEITVKREEHGLGSRYLHDQAKEGDMLQAQAPSGKFVFTGAEADSVVLIAGGVGITPMMSITRALTDMGWDGDIRLIVACRDPEHFIFRDELERLAERHANLHLHVAMSRLEEDIDGYHCGRLSKELLAEWVPDISSKRIHLCGAPPMMEATKAMLAELGVPVEQIHTENFGSQQKPKARAAEREKAGEAATAPIAATVTFQTSGQSTQFLPDETVLEAAERVGVEIENSCRTGMCGVCAVKLLSGQVTMDEDDGLDPDDRAAGKILACQAKASEDIVVEE